MSTPHPPLVVVESREGSRTRLRLRGELDIASVDFIAERLRRLRDRHESVLLDLDELTFMDASGIRLVLAAAEDSQGDGWPFAVTRGSPAVRRLFELVGLDEHLPYDGTAP